MFLIKTTVVLTRKRQCKPTTSLIKGFKTFKHDLIAFVQLRYQEINSGKSALGQIKLKFSKGRTQKFAPSNFCKSSDHLQCRITPYFD